MKSSQSNKDETILFIEHFHKDWCKVYYQDCHYEIYNLSVNQFLKKLNHNQNCARLCHHYHSPIRIGNDLFSPTMNIKLSNCEYFNLLKVGEKDPYFDDLLDQKNLLTKARLRFLEHTKRELFDLYQK